jgi:hypothetical protein
MGKSGPFLAVCMSVATGTWNWLSYKSGMCPFPSPPFPKQNVPVPSPPSKYSLKKVRTRLITSVPRTLSGKGPPPNDERYDKTNQEPTA